MDALGFYKAVFVGHGMGGAISLSLAHLYPDRVAAAVLVSSGPYLPIPSAILEDAVNKSTFPQAVKKLGNISFGPRTPVDQRELILKRLAQVRQTVLLNDLVACQHFDLSACLPTIDCPVLVVCGTGDKFTPIHLSETLSGEIPGAALQTVYEAGHTVILEQPRRLARMLQVFLSTIRYSPGT
jgi:pimeloyl-ACP methyl ester carboxylesterase